MQCDRATPLLSGLIDGALGPINRLRVRRHAARCAACAGKLDELRAMRVAIRTRLPLHRAPPGLAARVGAALSHEPVPVTPPRASWFGEPVIRLTGTGLAGALAGVALTLMLVNGAHDPMLAVVDSHIRSMQAEHLTDVPSSDQHTVKPWLSARLDVSPPTRDLREQGFPLIGGRLDYVDGHAAAVVVYQRAKHVINLLAWASPGADEAARTATRRGFNVITWRHDGIRYYAVSDVEADQLQQFVRLVVGG